MIHFTPISIHAPAKGAISRELQTDNAICISIHAPAKGATTFTQFPINFYRFQSTLPRRERQGRYTVTIKGYGFQSTLPRRERPLPIYVKKVYHGISIHAPAKGATQERQIKTILTSNFNPRPREGSDIGNFL